MTVSTHSRNCAVAVFVVVLAFGLRVVAAQQPAAPAKDVLVFTNGDQLSGSLERSFGGNVVFKSDMAGEITVPLAQVKELKTQGAFAVLKHGVPVAESRRTVPGKIVIENNAVTVATDAQSTAVAVPMKDVAYLVDAQTFQRDLQHRTSLLAGWGGTVNLGTSFTQATIHGGSVAAGVALMRQVPVLPYLRARNKTTVDFQENYGVLTTPAGVAGATEDVEAKTSIMHADAERDEYFSKTAYVLATTAFDHNFSQAMALQQLYGGGFGWTVFNTALQELDLKTDIHYEKQQHFDPTQNLNLIGSTFAESYRRSLPLKMSLTESGAILPAWNNMNAYSANGSLNVLAPLFRRLSLNLTASDSFINNPDPGFQKNSVTFTTGLTYTLP